MEIRPPDTPQEVEQIVARYSDTVYRLALAQMGNRPDAEDIFQEVFLRYIRKKPVFESEEHGKAWFLRVTVNCCKRFWSTPFRKRSVPLSDNLSVEIEEDWVKAEVNRLPKEYRAVLHLHYFEDLTAEQIGKLLNLRASSVRSRLTRARAMLRERMKGEYGNV